MAGDSDSCEMVMFGARFWGRAVPVRFPARIFQQENLDDSDMFQSYLNTTYFYVFFLSAYAYIHTYIYICLYLFIYIIYIYLYVMYVL